MGPVMLPRPPHPLFRAARAVVFATVCVTLATAGHALAAREAVPGWAVVTGFGAVLAVTLLLAGHERSLPTITGGLLGGQFALHALFTKATVAATAGAAAGHAGHTGHAVPTAADPAWPVLSGGCGMTLAHAAAALLAACWLWRGERAAWTLARRIAAAADRPIRLLLALLTARPPAPAPRVPAAAPPVVPAVGRALRHQVVRRGPPVRSRALAPR
ncbi:MFS transporter [Actinomadura sp. WAC 06369]|uniref:MFS transporter n=1 Tax=Actinomadura sp. WAC 06369 TaxID=2203193 RepID=UPI001000D9FA|nr:MFS transporter [Actinomadura sp. WAC 06369]RSN62134.1 MFS transporter [Actinomadura sp. WAC 06369]